MMREELIASDYINNLVGVRRRAFARNYWFHLSRDLPRPKIDKVFGAKRIMQRLDAIWKSVNITAWEI